MIHTQGDGYLATVIRRGRRRRCLEQKERNALVRHGGGAVSEAKSCRGHEKLVSCECHTRPQWRSEDSAPVYNRWWCCRPHINASQWRSATGSAQLTCAHTGVQRIRHQCTRDGGAAVLIACESWWARPACLARDTHALTVALWGSGTSVQEMMAPPTSHQGIVRHATRGSGTNVAEMVVPPSSSSLPP